MQIFERFKLFAGYERCDVFECHGLTLQANESGREDRLAYQRCTGLVQKQMLDTTFHLCEPDRVQDRLHVRPPLPRLVPDSASVLDCCAHDVGGCQISLLRERCDTGLERLAQRVGDERRDLPSCGDLALELVVPDHSSAGRTVWLTVLVGEVELQEPVAVERLQHGL